MADALERDRILTTSQSSPPDEDQLSCSASRRHDSVHSDEDSGTELPVISYIISAPPSTSANRPHLSASSASLTSSTSDDSSNFTEPADVHSDQFTKQTISRIAAGRCSGFSFSTQDTALFEARTLERTSMEFYPAVQDPLVSEVYDSSPPKYVEQTAVMDAVSNAMQQLQQIRLREQLHRPLRYEPRDKFHQPDAELVRKFYSSAYNELKIRRPNISDWLRIAVWWLLKVYLVSCDDMLYLLTVCPRRELRLQTAKSLV